jgi:ubiquinone/menaquinone biosynthesis C-methylase UbiE
VAAEASGTVLELGCGTGRISIPLAKSGVELVGVDRSQPMLDRARARASRTTRTSRTSRTVRTVSFVRADIRALPFKRRRFSMVLAPYGILQSLIRDRDLTDTLDAVARVITRGGTFGIDLVPDVPNWREYHNRVQLRGTAGGTRLTLIESVRQDPHRRLTTFDQQYVERRGGRERRHRFELTFRTLTIARMTSRLERAGFTVETVLGDYRGRPWDARADVWIILAKKG